MLLPEKEEQEKRVSPDTHQVPAEPGLPAGGAPSDRADAPSSAQFCLEGHLVHARAGIGAAGAPLRCPTCDSLTISKCPGCQEPIPGLTAGAAAPGSSPAPRSPRPPQYCDSCGRPFPWTEQLISAVRMAFRDIATLDRYERDQLRRSMEHITHETPETRSAVQRINASLARIGGEKAHSLRGLLLGIAADSVKPLLREE